MDCIISSHDDQEMTNKVDKNIVLIKGPETNLIENYYV